MVHEELQVPLPLSPPHLSAGRAHLASVYLFRLLVTSASECADCGGGGRRCDAAPSAAETTFRTAHVDLTTTQQTPCTARGGGATARNGRLAGRTQPRRGRRRRPPCTSPPQSGHGRLHASLRSLPRTLRARTHPRHAGILHVCCWIRCPTAAQSRAWAPGTPPHLIHHVGLGRARAERTCEFGHALQWSRPHRHDTRIHAYVGTQRLLSAGHVRGGPVGTAVVGVAVGAPAARR